MKLEKEQRHIGKEDPSASEVRRLLRKNFEELSVVMESGYLTYLNPEIITRMRSILGNKWSVYEVNLKGLFLVSESKDWVSLDIVKAVKALNLIAREVMLHSYKKDL